VFVISNRQPFREQGGVICNRRADCVEEIVKRHHALDVKSGYVTMQALF